MEVVSFPIEVSCHIRTSPKFHIVIIALKCKFNKYYSYD